MTIGKHGNGNEEVENMRLVIKGHHFNFKKGKCKEKKA